MRPRLFEELAPVCPRCLHCAGRAAGAAWPLTIGDAAESRDGRLWHGIVHCTNSACWMEYPVIDGVPVLVADPAEFLGNARFQAMAREALPGAVESLLGDALGPGGEFDVTRQHLGIYGHAHYADWSRAEGGADGTHGAGGAGGAGGEPPDIVGALRAGLEALAAEGVAAGGPAIDLGGSVGRAGWELARAGAGPVLVGDLNLSFLRFAQRLALEGTASFGRRRVGLVYDPVTVTLPQDTDGSRLDFWAVDAMALPFGAGAFGLATAINLVDSISGPTEAVAETARILAPGGGAVVATPHDWSQNAAEPARWMGGHSQRGPARGAAEPVLTATLARHGLAPVAERTGLPWRLRLHARAVMHYDLHLVACRRA